MQSQLIIDDPTLVIDALLAAVVSYIADFNLFNSLVFLIWKTPANYNLLPLRCSENRMKIH
jgi:hypothetical protein